MLSSHCRAPPVDLKPLTGGLGLLDPPLEMGPPLPLPTKKSVGTAFSNKRNKE